MGYGEVARWGRVWSGLVLVLGACASSRNVSSWREAEDRRDPDVALFRSALSAEPDAVAVVRAMGRLVAPELEPVIVEALARPATRAVAAWALGQYGLVDGFDAAHGPSLAALVAAARDGDPEVRAAVAVALGRLRAEDAVRVMLDDDDASVCAAAILGLFWTSQLAQRSLTDDSIVALLAVAETPAAADPDVRRALAVVFSKRPDARAEVLLQRLVKGGGHTAMFAIRALGKLDTQSLSTRVLLSVLVAEAPIVLRVEAILALETAVTADVDAHDDVRVRAARAQKTGALADDEPSGWVRALAIGQRAETTFDPAWLDDPDARVRAAGATGIAIAGEGWSAAFDKALSDVDTNVKLAALGALGTLPSPDAEARLVTLMRTLGPDVTLRGAVVEAAAERKSKALAPELAALAARSQEDRYVELRETVADTLVGLEAWDLLAAMRADPAASVRTKVARALATHAGHPPPMIDRRLAHASPFLGGDVAPKIALETDRGTVVIALDATLAPTTGAAITALVHRGFYDGTRFHRLVQNFVLQGGDPTGTGWGDAGFQLRDEVSELSFDAGAVGLAKSGPDTGSCQLFVMLAAAPHLDGRYTRVGHVVSGMDVVERIELGDIIRHARVVAAP